MNTRDKKLRGALDPRIQIALGVATTVVYANIVALLWNTGWVPRLDFWLSGGSLVVGILFGAYVGSMRLCALRKVLPEVEGEFYFSERGLLSKVREGANAMTLQRNSWAIAFLIWFFAAARSQLFYLSLASFILGSYLTGQVLPFIRLYFELKKNHET